LFCPIPNEQGDLRQESFRRALPKLPRRPLTRVIEGGGATNPRGGLIEGGGATNPKGGLPGLIEGGGATNPGGGLPVPGRLSPRGGYSTGGRYNPFRLGERHREATRELLEAEVEVARTALAARGGGGMGGDRTHRLKTKRRIGKARPLEWRKEPRKKVQGNPFKAIKA